MPRTTPFSISMAFLAGVLGAPAVAAVQAQADFQPRDPSAGVRGDQLHRPGSLAQGPIVGGGFFTESRAPMGDVLPDSEVRGPVESIGVDRGRLYFQRGGGSTWVRGRTYKAEAAASGFTYIPFLGSEAPQNYPVRFRLERAVLGDREIELTEAASVTQEGDRIILDRGSVDVIYDFALESVEQSFALDVAGATTDLTLEMDVVTELGAARSGGGFSFGNEFGGLRYGEAIVLDGAGGRASVAAEFTESRLTLTVPASFLETASGPILVDPLLTTFAVDAADGYQRDVEIAYVASVDRFLYVYEDQFSGTDVDIYGTDITPDGLMSRGDYMEFGTEDWTDPSAGSVTTASKALVAARSVAPGGNSIVGRMWDFGSGSFEPGIIQLTTPTTTVTQSSPDVGGSWAGSSTARFAVVWTADFGSDRDAQGAIVMPDGTVTSTLFLDSSTDFDSSEVCISESTGDPATVNRWNVSWINRRVADDQYTIEVTQLNAMGVEAFPPFPVVTLPTGQTVGELDVSDAITFDGMPLPVYTVAYDQSNSHAEDTFILFIEGGALLGSAELQRSEHADLALNQAEARLACNAQEFVVSYLEQTVPGSQYNGFITAFDFTEGEFLSISERRVPIGSVGASTATNTYTPRGGLALASRYSGGFQSSRYIGVGHDVGTGADADVAGHVYFPNNGYSPAFQYCYGNPNSTGDRGFIRLSGDRTATGPKEMFASALPTNAFGYFLVGDAFGNVPNPGGSAGVLCIGGEIGRYSNFVASSGSTGTIQVTFDPQQISQPTGAVTGMSGEFWQFTLWHRDAVSGSLTSNFTNAVSILFE